MTTSTNDSTITTFPKLDEWFSKKIKDVTIHEDPLDDPPKHLDSNFLDTHPPTLAYSSLMSSSSTSIQDPNPNNDSSTLTDTSNLPIPPPTRSS